jgi:hypothetical protein
MGGFQQAGWFGAAGTVGAAAAAGMIAGFAHSFYSFVRFALFLYSILCFGRKSTAPPGGARAIKKSLSQREKDLTAAFDLNKVLEYD